MLTSKPKGKVLVRASRQVAIVSAVACGSIACGIEKDPPGYPSEYYDEPAGELIEEYDSFNQGMMQSQDEAGAISNSEDFEASDEPGAGSDGEP